MKVATLQLTKHLIKDRAMKSFFVYFVAFFNFIIALDAVPAQVVIIRHAEKLIQHQPGPYLSIQGIGRSLSLSHYLPSMFPEPVALYAQGAKDNNSSLRCIQTLAPTAMYYAEQYPDKSDTFTLHTEYVRADTKKMAQDILSKTDYDYQTIIICWSHGEMQELATKLGVSRAPHWPKNNFDWMWIITYDAKTNVASLSIQTQPVPPMNLT